MFSAQMSRNQTSEGENVKGTVYIQRQIFPRAQISTIPPDMQPGLFRDVLNKRLSNNQINMSILRMLLV